MLMNTDQNHGGHESTRRSNVWVLSPLRYDLNPMIPNLELMAKAIQLSNESMNFRVFKLISLYFVQWNLVMPNQGHQPITLSHQPLATGHQH